MSTSSSSVYRSKAKSRKSEPSDNICACGGQTKFKYSRLKANPDRRYLCCLGGCGFLRWADVADLGDGGAKNQCKIFLGVIPSLLQTFKDKDDLAKCKDKLVQDVMKWKMFVGIA
ncbi:hypothetical protein Hanom_Chr16g01452601 [Helianthus anomalus]